MFLANATFIVVVAYQGLVHPHYAIDAPFTKDDVVDHDCLLKAKLFLDYVRGVLHGLEVLDIICDAMYGPCGQSFEARSLEMCILYSDLHEGTVAVVYRSLGGVIGGSCPLTYL